VRQPQGITAASGAFRPAGTVRAQRHKSCASLQMAGATPGVTTVEAGILNALIAGALQVVAPHGDAWP